MIAYHTIPIALLFTLAFLFLRSGRLRSGLHGTDRLVLLCGAAAVALYVVKIGGDPRHFRYLAFSYCLAIAAGGGIAEHVVERLELGGLRPAIVGLTVVFAVVALLAYPRQLVHHPVFRGNGYAHTPLFKIYDISLHRLNDSWTPALLGNGSEIEQRAAMQSYRALRTERTVKAAEPVAEGGCANAYVMFDRPIIHNLGLTEPFLARTRMLSDRPAHKLGLIPLADDLVALRRRYGFRKGAFRRAVQDGIAPRWVARNLEHLEIIEEKAYNTHDFTENLSLALTRIPAIEP